VNEVSKITESDLKAISRAQRTGERSEP
jgi:hypothetical protein